MMAQARRPRRAGTPVDGHVAGRLLNSRQYGRPGPAGHPGAPRADPGIALVTEHRRRPPAGARLGQNWQHR